MPFSAFPPAGSPGYVSGETTREVPHAHEIESMKARVGKATRRGVRSAHAVLKVLDLAVRDLADRRRPTVGIRSSNADTRPKRSRSPFQGKCPRNDRHLTENVTFLSGCRFGGGPWRVGRAQSGVWWAVRAASACSIVVVGWEWSRTVISAAGSGRANR